MGLMVGLTVGLILGFMVVDGGENLVGGDWNIFFFQKQLGMSSSQLTKSYFSEGLAQPPTSPPLSSFFSSHL